MVDDALTEILDRGQKRIVALCNEAHLHTGLLVLTDKKTIPCTSLNKKGERQGGPVEHYKLTFWRECRPGEPDICNHD